MECCTHLVVGPVAGLLGAEFLLVSLPTSLLLWVPCVLGGPATKTASQVGPLDARLAALGGVAGKQRSCLSRTAQQQSISVADLPRCYCATGLQAPTTTTEGALTRS